MSTLPLLRPFRFVSISSMGRPSSVAPRAARRIRDQATRRGERLSIHAHAEATMVSRS